MKKTHVFTALAALLLFAACKKEENATTNSYEIDSEASVVNWKGFLKNGYFNEGTIEVQGDDIEVKNGLVQNGSFTMPLLTLKNLNLPDEQKPVLIHHLQSADFFNMVLHPNLTFTINDVAAYNSSDPGSVPNANYLVSGTLSMLGKSLPVSFPAHIVENNTQLLIKAKLKIDRTKWGMNYSSDPGLPDDAYILPEVALDLFVKANKN